MACKRYPSSTLVSLTLVLVCVSACGHPDTHPRRHDVRAMPIIDPVSGHAALLLLQTDITSRAKLETRMAALMESQLTMLEQMFPR